MSKQAIVLEWSDQQIAVGRDSLVACSYISPEDWVTSYCSIKLQGEGWRLPSIHLLQMAFEGHVSDFQKELYLTDRWNNERNVKAVNMENGQIEWVDIASQWGGNPTWGDGQMHHQLKKKVMIRLVRHVTK